MPLITTRVTNAIDATTKNAPLSNTEIDTNFINLNTAIIQSGDGYGFSDRTSSTISFNNSTRTLTLAPTGVSFTVYFKGKSLIVNSSKTITLTNSSGGRYIGLNFTSGNLEDLGSAPNFATNIMVAYVYWNITDSSASFFADERHLVSRDTTWQAYQHSTTGAIWKSGGDATYTINNANTVQLGFSSPIVFSDEDLDFTITHSNSPTNQYEQIITSAANLPVLYLSGTSYRQTSATSVPWYPSSTRAYYNQISGGSGSLVTAASDGLYMCYWAILTNDSQYPVKLVMGRNTYATMQEADSEAFTDYGLPMPELVPMYKFILQTSSTFTQNTARVNIVAVKELISRQNSRNNAFKNLSHDSLSDKNSADQHTIASITGLQTQLDTASGSAVAMAIALG